MRYIRWFDEIGLQDVPEVGGKNASLGELRREMAGVGVRVPDGFAITAGAFRHVLEENQLAEQVTALEAGLRPGDVPDIERRSEQLRALLGAARLPDDLRAEVMQAHDELLRREGQGVSLAVRSSATAEDLPNASFAGQQESFLNVHGVQGLLSAYHTALASLYSARALSYRADLGFGGGRVALSVGVQRMVRADLGASGVIFTLDPDSGFREVVLVSGIWGLGENLVQGRVAPDEWTVHKPTLALGFSPIVRRVLGAKEQRLVYGENGQGVRNVPTPLQDRARLCLSEAEVLTLARWAMDIEAHYSAVHGHPTPMDIEWARDGLTGELFILQARPETVHSQRPATGERAYHLDGGGPVLVRGTAIGTAVATGAARVLPDPSGIERFGEDEVLVTDVTSPDWEPIMRRASAIVTERGGRTSHAAIVARELGVPAIVGASGAMRALTDAGTVTVSCAEGETGCVYAGSLPFTVTALDPASLPATRTRVTLNVAQPDQAFAVAALPSDGVGLCRMEFVLANAVRVHPLAVTRFGALAPEVQARVHAVTGEDHEEYFVGTLARGIGTIAAAFYPREVILRFSDFKTNEYAHLTGGADFEPREENPMLGWRGASRYAHPEYADGFALEVRAVRRVRETFGLKNLMVMVPFCRTPQEGRTVLDAMAKAGLARGQGGLKVYVMAEIPSNVILAEDFAALFDGFSIGSNDLTQLVLGVDRDSTRVSGVFDERHAAVTRAIADLIARAHAAGRTVGLCGQAPSDHPEFAAFLVGEGIDSVSVTPDAFVPVKRTVAQAEVAEAGRVPVARGDGG